MQVSVIMGVFNAVSCVIYVVWQLMLPVLPLFVNAVLLSLVVGLCICILYTFSSAVLINMQCVNLQEYLICQMITFLQSGELFPVGKTAQFCFLEQDFLCFQQYWLAYVPTICLQLQHIGIKNQIWQILDTETLYIVLSETVDIGFTTVSCSSISVLQSNVLLMILS